MSGEKSHSYSSSVSVAQIESQRQARLQAEQQRLEAQRERQRQLELERARIAEEQRRLEAERQRQLELERARIAEEQRQKIAAIEQARQTALAQSNASLQAIEQMTQQQIQALQVQYEAQKTHMMQQFEAQKATIQQELAKVDAQIASNHQHIQNIQKQLDLVQTLDARSFSLYNNIEQIMRNNIGMKLADIGLDEKGEVYMRWQYEEMQQEVSAKVNGGDLTMYNWVGFDEDACWGVMNDINSYMTDNNTIPERKGYVRQDDQQASTQQQIGKQKN